VLALHALINNKVALREAEVKVMRAMTVMFYTEVG
jgi:hypothetical protein